MTDLAMPEIICWVNGWHRVYINPHVLKGAMQAEDRRVGGKVFRAKTVEWEDVTHEYIDEDGWPKS